MKFEEQHEFPKGWDVVQKMFSDPAYFENKYRMLHNTNLKILSQEKKAESFRIKVSYEQKATIQLPAFASKFVGKTATVEQEDSWNLKTGEGHISIQLKGLPVKISTDMKITDNGKGCTNQLRWEVKCSVPLIGGKLEKLLTQDLQKKSRFDLAASRSLLKKY